MIRQALVESDAGREVPFAIVASASGRAVGSTRYLDLQRPHRGLEIGWTWIGAVLPIVSPFRDYMDRGRNLTSSSDSSFLRRLRTDPLEGWKTSTHWLKDVRRWGAQASSARFAPSRWFLLQGDQDATVEFHHDIDWIADRTGGLRVRIFKGGRHHLHNEAGPLGALVQASLDSAIGGGLPLARK